MFYSNICLPVRRNLLFGNTPEPRINIFSTNYYTKEKEYAELLKDSGFLCVHKSRLIDLNYIDKFNKTDGGYLIMKDTSPVPVSQQKKDTIFDFFDSLN